MVLFDIVNNHTYEKDLFPTQLLYCCDPEDMRSILAQKEACFPSMI